MLAALTKLKVNLLRWRNNEEKADTTDSKPIPKVTPIPPSNDK